MAPVPMPTQRDSELASAGTSESRPSLSARSASSRVVLAISVATFRPERVADSSDDRRGPQQSGCRSGNVRLSRSPTASNASLSKAAISGGATSSEISTDATRDTLGPAPSHAACCSSRSFRRKNTPIPSLMSPPSRACTREPCHHTLEKLLDDYIAAASIAADPEGPLFRTTGRKTGKPQAMWQQDAYRMVQRRAARAGIKTKICNHTFRATGITDYLKGKGTLEHAQTMANHASPRTTKLYDRLSDEITLDEVEKISI